MVRICIINKNQKYLDFDKLSTYLNYDKILKKDMEKFIEDEYLNDSNIINFIEITNDFEIITTLEKNNVYDESKDVGNSDNLLETPCKILQMCYIDKINPNNDDVNIMASLLQTNQSSVYGTVIIVCYKYINNDECNVSLIDVTSNDIIKIIRNRCYSTGAIIKENEIEKKYYCISK